MKQNSKLSVVNEVLEFVVFILIFNTLTSENVFTDRSYVQEKVLSI